MKDVFKDRAEAIMRKKNIEEEEKKELIKEREIINKEIDDYYDHLNELKEKEIIKYKNKKDKIK